MSGNTRRNASEGGNALLFCMLALVFLVGISTAQFAVTQKNMRQSNAFLSHSDLYKYAESGIDMAFHDLRYEVTGNEGNIGTAAWVAANDLGRDGYPGTYDEGEGDGVPGFGEPNVAPVAVGSLSLGASLIAHVSETAYANILRLVGAATNGEVTVTVERYMRRTPRQVPVAGAVYVDPNVALDLRGNAFSIDGNDYNPDNTAGPAPAIPGLATLEGDTPGDNQAALLAQIDPQQHDQILGLGGAPSMGEQAGVDLGQVFDAFAEVQTQSLPGGTYATVNWGTWTDPEVQVTHVDGDLRLTDGGTGAGVLLVEGSLRITGQFTFYGAVIVKGDLILSGAGSNVHVYGTTMIGQTLTALDEDEVSLTGNAKLYYSSATLVKIAQSLPPTYAFLYYTEH
jgi:hypothetical protein